MTNTQILAICCLALGGACLVSCAPNSVNMKPDSTIAAEIVATPSPEPSPSAEPTPAEIAPAATPEAQPAPATSGQDSVRKVSKTKKTIDRIPPNPESEPQPMATDRSAVCSGEQSNGQGASCGAETAAVQGALAQENSAVEFWTPTPIAAAGSISRAEAEPEAAGRSAGWLLAGLALLLAVAALALTYRRMHRQTAKQPASELPPRTVSSQGYPEPTASRKAEPDISAPAEPEIRTAVRPEPVVPAPDPEVPAAAPATAARKPTPVRRVRKPAAKPRMVKAAAKPAGKTIKKLKSEVRKKAA